MPKNRHPTIAPGRAPYPPRNFWKASLYWDGDSVVKDYAQTSLIPRIYGRICIRREEEALKRLNGIEGIPLFQGRPTPYSIKMSAVPGTPIGKLKKGELDEPFLHRLVNLFQHMHERGVAHRDAHQRNILSYNNRPYLVDFSTAYVSRDRMALFERYLFRRFMLLDLKQVYKVEKKFFGRGNPPKMFFLYRVFKGDR